MDTAKLDEAYRLYKEGLITALELISEVILFDTELALVNDKLKRGY
jgi:hypothetical protein